jgi:hypothetical protein
MGQPVPADPDALERRLYQGPSNGFAALYFRSIAGQMNGAAWCFLILTSISLKPEMKINSTTVQWIRLKKIIQASLLLCGVFPFLAHGHVLSDLGGATAYWGGNAHGYGDVIGDSTYNVNGAEVSLSNSMLSIRILTNFAGHAGQDGWAGPNGIGYGDVFLAQSWNPFGSDAHHVNDDASNGTLWTYGFSLDDR